MAIVGDALAFVLNFFGNDNLSIGNLDPADMTAVIYDESGGTVAGAKVIVAYAGGYNVSIDAATFDAAGKWRCILTYMGATVLASDEAIYEEDVEPAVTVDNSAIAVAVVDQTLSGHTTSGTVGGALNSAGSAADPWLTDIRAGLADGTYDANTVAAILALIGTQRGTILVPSTTRGDVLPIKIGIGYTRHNLYYNCDLVTPFDEDANPIKLFIDMPYGGAAQFVKTIDPAYITTTADYTQVNPYSVLTSAVTNLMPPGEFDAQIVLFNGAGNTEKNVIMTFSVNVSVPGFNYSASDS